jgi:hypothetical protein
MSALVTSALIVVVVVVMVVVVVVLRYPLQEDYDAVVGSAECFDDSVRLIGTELKWRTLVSHPVRQLAIQSVSLSVAEVSAGGIAIICVVLMDVTGSSLSV